MKTYPMYFYIYHGSWLDIFDELKEMFGADTEQYFTILTPQNKTKDHCLVIVYGMPIADSYCYRRDIWRSDENVFKIFYLPHLEAFNIYGYKEFLEPFLPVAEVA